MPTLRRLQRRRCEKTVTTGAEPWNIVISPDGKRVFVANSGQDTITVINALTRTVIGQVDLRNSLCNDPDRKRHFQPRGLAVTLDNTQLYVTRFLSFTRAGGEQAVDRGQGGRGLPAEHQHGRGGIAGYVPAGVIRLAARPTGFAVDSNGDGVPGPDVRLPEPAAEHRAARRPRLPAQHRGLAGRARSSSRTPPRPSSTSSGRERRQPDRRRRAQPASGRPRPGAGQEEAVLRQSLGDRLHQPGRRRLAYVVSAGSDLLVKLNVAANGALEFTVDADTTRYIDLNGSWISTVIGG